MKIHSAFAQTVAAAGFLALAVPAPAQKHGNGGGGGGNSNHGGTHHGGGNYYCGNHGYRHSGNFFFGGVVGYPFFGYPYYGYPYGYAPYGNGVYGYPAGAYVTYDPRGVYQGRVVSSGTGRSSLAAQLQQELAAAGYYHGAIDGIVGDGTRRAIRSYERANGLPVNGRIDGPLLAAIGLD